MHFVFAILIISLVQTDNILAEEINKPSVRIETKYFSVLKLPGYDWEVDKENTKVVFGKFNKKTVESHLIVVSPYGDKKYNSRDELDKDVLKNINKEMGSDRYEKIKFESGDYTVDNTKCTKHYYLVKDLKVPRRMRKFDFMYVESVQTVCMHPLQKNVAIYIFYSHRWRYTRDPIHEEYKKQANEFLGQIKFLE